MASFEEYELPPNDVRKLCVLCGQRQTEDQDKLPELVRRQYYDDRLRADRLGVNFGDHDLWNIVCRAAIRLRNESVPNPEQPNPTVFELFRKKKIAVGQAVLCTWRGKEVVGKIVGTKGKNVLATLADDGEERQFSADKIRLPDKDYAIPQKKPGPGRPKQTKA